MATRRAPTQSPDPRRRSLALMAAISLVACSGDLPAILEPGSRIFISPPETSLLVGETELFTAQAHDADNRTIDAPVRWASSNPTVASVDKTSGFVTAVSAGTATITVAVGRLTARATITVLPAGPAKVSTSTSALSLILGAAERIVAQVFDAKGRVLGVPILWSSSNPTIATVTSDGVVNAIAAGTTTVTANAGALAATVTVSVIEITPSVILLTRYSNPSRESFSSEVLLYSVLDNALTPLSSGSDLGSIANPAWSPDGSLVAVEVLQVLYYDDINHWTDYQSDLYVLGEGSPRALTTDGQSRKPSWSPDGSRIAFVKRPANYSGSHIYVIGADGAAPTRLTQREGRYDTPRWSPAGARLAFSDVSDRQHDVYVMNADGTGLQNLTRHAAYDAEPSWSPDGWKIAFVSDRYGGRPELLVSAADGGTPQRLTALGGSVTAPVWSPDGRQIVFTLASSPVWPSGLYVVNADGSSLTRLIGSSSDAVDLAFAWRSSSFRRAASARAR